MSYVVKRLDNMICLSRMSDVDVQCVAFVFEKGTWSLLKLPEKQEAEYKAQSLPGFLDSLVAWGWGDITIATFQELACEVVCLEGASGIGEANI